MFKKIFVLGLVVCLAACASSPYCKHKRGEDHEVRAVKTIPVETLKVKVVETKPVMPHQKAIAPYLASTIYFADGSAYLDHQDKAELNQLAYFAKEKNLKLKVLGHASSHTRDTDIGTHKLINFNVSYERAQNVMNYLIKKGVRAQDISFEALSDSRPVASETMPSGERLNRRVEVYAN